MLILLSVVIYGSMQPVICLTGVARGGGGGHHDALRAPIITGCLGVCGVEDQSCVTECQVCVESQRCNSLEDCHGCTPRRHTLNNFTKDSGGPAMVRDGLRMQWQQARLLSLTGHRNLRIARNAVLEAQRTSEWAAEERTTQTKLLNEMEEALQAAKKSATKKSLHRAKHLKKMRDLTREVTIEKQEAEQRLAKAQRTVQSAEAGKDLKDAQVTARQSLGQVKKEEARWEVVKEAYEKKNDDTNWRDSQQTKELETKQKALTKQISHMRQARQMDALSRETLEEEKAKYWKVLVATEMLDEKAAALKTNLTDQIFPDRVKSEA